MKKNNLHLFVSFVSLIICTQSQGSALQDRHILDSLSLDEKIGQLFMVAAVVNPERITKPSQHPESEIMAFIEQYHIGGVIYLERSKAEQQLAMTRRLKTFNRAHNKIELWVGLDAEWGPHMRLENTVKFPYNLTLGAIQDDTLVYELGLMIGQQLKFLGNSINFAPVVDINTNPNNPVINRRSFGQNPIMVAQKAYAYAQGLAQAGIMACAKHFPGHGDTDIDSHKGLPIISHEEQRIRTIELYPFMRLIDKGIEAIMVGHLLLPAFDDKLPATLSRTLTTNLLKKYCHFDGLITTDALDMQGVTDICQPGLIELHALQAGADLLLVPLDVSKAIASIKKAIIEGTLPIEDIDEHVLKIIHAKTVYAHHEGCLPDQIDEKLNDSQAQELSKKLYQKAITIVRDEKNIIPLASTEKPLALILIGLNNPAVFAATLSISLPIQQTSYISHVSSEIELEQMHAITDKAKTIIIGLSRLTYQVHNNFGLSLSTINFINDLQEHNKQIILVLFGNPYALKLFENIPVLIEAYEDHPYAQQAAAQIIMGTLKAEGKLPITA